MISPKENKSRKTDNTNLKVSLGKILAKHYFLSFEIKILKFVQNKMLHFLLRP